ncbi:MAG: hypothetical protein EOO23_07665 [Comamonadaceae bacterium]|nr:MAG: hypothetical protein EOO23_07665 [Comamonadaceae bacterium]
MLIDRGAPLRAEQAGSAERNADGANFAVLALVNEFWAYFSECRKGIVTVVRITILHLSLNRRLMAYEGHLNEIHRRNCRRSDVVRYGIIRSFGARLESKIIQQLSSCAEIPTALQPADRSPLNIDNHRSCRRCLVSACFL